jgi:uncharacterized protein (TIGR00255 family)
MSKSMTAYGRASDTFPLGKLVVEIHSVNRKMRDMLVYLPKDFLRFDIDVRKWVASEIERGQITVRVSLLNEGESKKSGENQLAQLKMLQAEWTHVASALGFDPSDCVDLRFLVGQMHEDVLFDFKEEEYRGALQRVVHAALDELMQMKLTEARSLTFDIHKRLQFIEEQLLTVEKKKEEPFDRYRKKIIDRLQEIEQITPDLEERIAREIVFLAERMDVTEELVRLRAHIAQFRHNLASTDKAVGRTLEFLTQEMLREINTLGSKSMDTEISSCVVIIKSELEKVREQIQNIE